VRRLEIARGFFFAVAVPIAVAMLVGCSSPGAPAAFPPAQAFIKPQFCFLGSCSFHVLPRRSTIELDQQITLHDDYRICSIAGCTNGMVNAAWHSRGGSLHVIDEGKKAVFSASSPGTYTVFAKYDDYGQVYRARAQVTVTSALEKK